MPRPRHLFFCLSMSIVFSFYLVQQFQHYQQAKKSIFASFEEIRSLHVHKSHLVAEIEELLLPNHLSGLSKLEGIDPLDFTQYPRSVVVDPDLLAKFSSEHQHQTSINDELVVELKHLSLSVPLASPIRDEIYRILRRSVQIDVRLDLAGSHYNTRLREFYSLISSFPYSMFNRVTPFYPLPI